MQNLGKPHKNRMEPEMDRVKPPPSVNRRRRVAVAGVALGMAVAGVLAAAPAQAAAPSYCPATYTCLWRDISFQTNGATNGVIKLQQYIPVLANFNYAYTLLNGHDSASSVYNNGATDTAYYFKNENHTGSWFKKAPGSGDSDFTNGSPAGSFNDTLDSVYFASNYTPSGG